jgi:hypothetical protein
MRLAWALVAGLAVFTAELLAALWLLDRWLILPLRRFSATVDRSMATLEPHAAEKLIELSVEGDEGGLSFMRIASTSNV